MQVRSGCRQPPSPIHVPVERREALLPETVHVVGERISRLLHGLEERAEQRARRRTALQHERPGMPAEPVVPVGRERALHALEVREAVRVVPVSMPGSDAHRS